MAESDLLRRVALESLRAATQSLDARAAEAVAFEVGRRVGTTLTDEAAVRDAARELGLDLEPPLVPDHLADAFLRGLASAPGDRAAATQEPPRPAPPWATPGRARDLVTATRRAMHDLNQPLTVILGYAAILKRAGTEPVRLEAAEHIIREARKMNEIIAGLSRMARGLDAA